MPKRVNNRRGYTSSGNRGRNKAIQRTGRMAEWRRTKNEAIENQESAPVIVKHEKPGAFKKLKRFVGATIRSLRPRFTAKARE